MNHTLKKSLLVTLFPALIVGLSGCSDNDSSSNSAPGNNNIEFEVSVTNLSANQPFSPIAVIYHKDGYSAWSIGDEASSGLEELAESGMNEAFVTEAENHDAHLAAIGDDEFIGPGQTHTISASFANDDADIELTFATMLVNTNDAFTGLSGWHIGELQVGESLTRLAPIYDAGTEFNSEEAGTIPGPADSSGIEDRGFNPEREVSNVVTRHPGVVTQGVEGGFDENPDSVLDESHRFDAPIAKIVVTRVN